MDIKEDRFDGRIVRVQPDGQFIGTYLQGAQLKPGQRVAVFELGEEIFDPTTAESLGRLENLKAVLIIQHLQARLVQLRSLDEPVEADGRVLSAVMADINAGKRSPREQPIRVGDMFRGLPPEAV